ncbi:MAG: hypothetical protein FJ096_08415 [Deltaproteobacteria bacterium]|nr:hypothetical protein [Deltaproteobacteria bacterium]
MKIFVRGLGSVTLEPDDFVARGGQASVHARGDIAYKLFTDPDAMVPVGKLQELAAIANPDVVRPDALIQDHRTGRAIGYTMRYLRDTRPLCQLIPPSFRTRHGIDLAKTLHLVEQLRSLFVAVHAAGALVVDANDMNFLVDATFDRVYAIDTDSYQTRTYPASAVTPSICDPLAIDAGGHASFSTGSDWFSFAVLAFQLFVGAHPYRGTHPDVRAMSERMRHRLSAFDRAVTLPPAALATDAIPEPYRRYLRAVLQDGARTEAPERCAGSVVAARRVLPLKTAAPNTGLTLEPLVTLPCSVRAVLESNDGDAVVECEDRLHTLSGRALATVPRGPRLIALAPRSARPVAAVVGTKGISLHDLTSGLELEPPGRLDDVTLGGGRLIARIGDALVELGLREVGSTLIVTPQVLARVLPRATRLFEGVAVQSLLGATYLSLLGGARGCRQVRVPELDGVRVIDARADRNVVVAVVASGDRRDRAIVRVSEGDGGHDVRWSRDVEPDLPEVVVLDSGVCLCRADGRTIEVFSSDPRSLAFRQVCDPRLPELRLARHGGRALAFREDVVYRLSSRA